MLELDNVSKFYYKKGMITTGFSRVSLKFDMGEFIAITGESGSGKSTLLNVISGLDSYEEGEMYINGEETSYYTEKDYEKYRKKYIGNIFQNFNLVNSYTVYQNIELIYLLNGFKAHEVKDEVNDLIKKVDLVKYKNRKVSKLSGGQKQRVAIARALAQNTPIILADEPTGNLDKKSSESVLELLHEISKDKLVIIVTHNYDQIEKYVTRKITMNDGKVIEDKQIKKHDEVTEIEVSNYNNMRTGSKVRLGIRNAFNILSKFLIITFVYLFVILSLFVTYAAFIDTQAVSKELNENYYFDSSNDKRIVINKKDRSNITEEDYNKISSLDNVDYIIKNDYMIDYQMSINNDNYWFSGKVNSIKEIDKVDYGRLPENDNEIVLKVNKEYNYQLDDKKIDKTFDEEYDVMELYDARTDKYEKVKIVGAIFITDDYKSYIYLTDNMLDKINNRVHKNYNSKIKYEFLGTMNESYISSVYGELLPSSKVKKGKAIISDDYTFSCKNFNCKNKKIKIYSSNIYNEFETTVKVANTYTKKNFNKLTGYDYKTFDGAIFINDKEYEELFDNNNYQSSVYIKDDKLANQTIKKLNDLGYKTLYVKETISEGNNSTIVRVLNIIRLIVNITLVVVLFFISYFVIKLVLKSRNIYYSTLRILGSTIKDTKKLLNIELFTFVNIGYILFLIILELNKRDIINLSPVKTALKYSSVKLFVIVYILVAIMSLLTTSRYSRKLFVSSVMNTYREEV